MTIYAGIAGAVTRPESSITESRALGAGDYSGGFGLGLKIANGSYTAIAAGDAATTFAGLLVRAAGEIGSTVDTARANSVLVKGYANVRCEAGTPALGGTVYMRNAAAAGYSVGGFSATAGTGYVALPANITWNAAGLDENGCGEIRIA